MNDFMQNFKKQDGTKEAQEFNNEMLNNEILEELESSKLRLRALHENMNYAEGNLVDYYTYQIKAEEAKYGYLLKKLKN